MEGPTNPAAVRGEKLRRLREKGIDPFPHVFHRSHLAAEILRDFVEIEEKQPVRVAGRLLSWRPMGKTAFGHVEDSSGRLQLYFREETLGAEAYSLLKEIDLGDFVGAAGPVFRTRMGEVTVRVDSFSILAKAMRSLPVVKEKDGQVFDAFQDREARYRQRYLDLILNPESREIFRRRSRAIAALRSELDARGFLEVETPVLQSVYGGALARPFVTHHNALDADLYLRIAEELPLKKLIVGGLERVYEIGRVFRNEGLDRFHNPEFTMLEFYWAYADYNDAMDLVEDLFRSVARAVTGGLTVTSNGRAIDLEPDFARIPMMTLLNDAMGDDVLALSTARLLQLCADNGSPMNPATPPGKLIEKLFDLKVAPELRAPTFVCDYPKIISPLAKTHRTQPDQLVERFELFIDGQELANAFSELNDPEDQRRRFEDQAGLRAAGDEETHPLDEDFLTALEHGMPPTAGVGIGVDRFVMLLTGAAAIRDVLLFPHMRPATGDVAEDEAK